MMRYEHVLPVFVKERPAAVYSQSVSGYGTHKAAQSAEHPHDKYGHLRPAEMIKRRAVQTAGYNKISGKRHDDLAGKRYTSALNSHGQDYTNAKRPEKHEHILYKLA